MEENFEIHGEGLTERDKEYEKHLRPLSFSDFRGQHKTVENLKVFVQAARQREEALDHVLLHGPPGLGKTTLAYIIAGEMDVNLKVTSGPVLDKPGDLAGILTGLEESDVLFIDEIHRLSPVVEEYLYSAMEDYRIDLMIDKGPSARSIQLDLNPFTLIGATTRSGLLTSPLRARFGIKFLLEYYDAETLEMIIIRSSSILGVDIDPVAANELSSRSRGTPRIANALLRRVRDFAQVKGSGRIDLDITKYSLEAMNIDGFVSIIGWSLSSIAKYFGKRLTIPTAMTVTEAFQQTGSGAHFVKLSGSDLDFVSRCRQAAAFDYCPIFVTGGMTPERIPEAISKGAVVVGAGFDLIFKGLDTNISVEQGAEHIKGYIDAVKRARAQYMPELVSTAGTDNQEWLDSLPHYHPF